MAQYIKALAVQVLAAVWIPRVKSHAGVAATFHPSTWKKETGFS